MTAAIVLRQVDVGEADRIVSLLTPDRGRVEVRVPQARKSRKRFGGLDLFVLAEVEFALKKGAPRLSEARVLCAFDGIRQDLERMALASYAVALVRKASQEEQSSDELFRLTIAALESLDRAPSEPVGGLGWARAFELKLLHVLGCRPELRHCVSSGELLDGSGAAHWSVRQGGLLSGEMLHEDPGARPFALAAALRLDAALRTPLAEQHRLAWSADEERQAAVAMEAFVGEHVGPTDRALRFLKQVVSVFVLGLFAGLSGCEQYQPPAEVNLFGYLYSSPAPEDDSQQVPEVVQASVWSASGEVLVEGSQPYSEYPAWWSFGPLEPDTPVHVVFHAPDEAWASTLLTGRTAVADLYLDPGGFHVWTSAELTGLQEASFELAGGMEARPDFEETGAFEPGVVLGRLADPEGQLGARLHFTDEQGGLVEALYLDEEGQPSLEPGTTADGGFLVEGLRPGRVEVAITGGDGVPREGVFETWVSAGTVTSLQSFVIPESGS